MGGLITTLGRELSAADELFRIARWPAARNAFEGLVERAQERSDPSVEVVARSMLSRCLLAQQDVETAFTSLELARSRLPLASGEARLRWRAARVRVLGALGEASIEELKLYFSDAEDQQEWVALIDAARLLADAQPDSRIDWLERALHFAQEHCPAEVGPVARGLAFALEAEERFDAAIAAWHAAWDALQALDSPVRERIMASWAIGSLSCRAEDWPAAFEWLETCLQDAGDNEDCGDVVALTLADLARAHEAAGDVIEARRVLIRALNKGRDYDLASLWPARWDAIVVHARTLDLDPYEVIRRS